MKTNAYHKSAAMLAIATLMLAGPAQAAMGPCQFAAPAPAAEPGCADAQAGSRACPVQGHGGQAACPTGQQGLGAMVGNMAAGGIQIAASVMRAMAGESSRQLASEP